MGLTKEERLKVSDFNRAQYRKRALNRKPKFFGFRRLGRETPEEFLARLARQKEIVRKALNY